MDNHPRDGRLAPGRVVAGYRLERLLGRGGVAEVYLARRESDGALRALKFVYASSASLAKRMKIEGVVQQVVQHSNLVPVHEVLEVDHAPVLVMEYVEGPSLAEWAADHAPVPIEDCVELFRQIVLGVRAAHGAGLIHRDLKPANVLLSVDSDPPQPRITDFGLAKLTGIQGATIAGTALGTPEYAAPEQGRDASRVDQRADLYSLGCILYELLCGRSPFAGLEPYRMLMAQKNRTYREVREVRPEAPEALVALVDDLIAYAPDDRPADCDAILDRLDVFSAPAPAPPRSPEWMRLLPLAMLPLAAAFLGAAAALAFGA